MENQYKKRIRIEVGTSVKGIHTYSCTIEIIDSTNEDALTESDALVEALDKRYPPAQEK